MCFAWILFLTLFLVLLGKSAVHAQACSVSLEAAGAGILQREPLPSIGEKLVQAGTSVQSLSELIGVLVPERQEAKDAGQRMAVAASKMIEAGNGLQGIMPKATGKSFLKGGI
jgi:hypothetical protein